MSDGRADSGDPITSRCYWLLVGQFDDSAADRTKSVLTAIGVATSFITLTTAIVTLLEGSNLAVALSLFAGGIVLVVFVYVIAIGRLDSVLFDGK